MRCFNFDNIAVQNNQKEVVKVEWNVEGIRGILLSAKPTVFLLVQERNRLRI